MADKPVAGLRFRIELEFGNVGFLSKGKIGVPGEKPLGARMRTNKYKQQTQPTYSMTPSPGIEPGPHWWEESALTTVPSLLPNYCSLNNQR